MLVVIIYCEFSLLHLRWKVFFLLDTIIFFPIIDNKLVKFSEDGDLTEDKCHELLQKYMCESIKRRKITQRLFIK